MTNAKHDYQLLDSDNSTERYVLTDNGEPIAEFYHEADATLPLAAPELLEALKERVIAEEKEAHEAGHTNTPWLDKARAAIAKAEGQ